MNYSKSNLGTCNNYEQIQKPINEMIQFTTNHIKRSKYVI